jgi:hypothetical protein
MGVVRAVPETCDVLPLKSHSYGKMRYSAISGRQVKKGVVWAECCMYPIFSWTRKATKSHNSYHLLVEIRPVLMKQEKD